MSTFARAVSVAADFYAGRTHWCGESMLHHYLRVALALEDPELQVLGILSGLDVANESVRKLLRKEHFPPIVVRTLTWARRRRGESDLGHLARLRSKATTRLLHRTFLITALRHASQLPVTATRRRRLEEACRSLAILDGSTPP